MSEDISEVDFGVYNCSEFYTDFLDPLSDEVRMDTFRVIHETNTLGAQSDGATARYTEMLLRIEREIGPDHFVCEVAARQMAESLRKFGLLDDAVGLISGRMDRIKSKDFGSMLLIARMHSLCGNYHDSMSHIIQARELSEGSNDPVLLCLALIKEACVLWHLQDCDLAEEKLSLSLHTLREVEAANRNVTFPFSETTLRLIDIYKTLGYTHRFIGNRLETSRFYIKALDIVAKDTKAIAHRFKLESLIGYEFCRNHNKPSAELYCMMAYEKIKVLAIKDEYMANHSLTVINAMSRVAFSLRGVMKNQLVLDIWEHAYSIARKRCGENHPTTARLAADTVFYCMKLKDKTAETFYLERAVSSLSHCLEIGDYDFIKRHVRELSDSWTLLGRVYMASKNFNESEKSFKEALVVNTRVYGCNHPRLSKIYYLMGYMYKSFNKYYEGTECFHKCKKIHEEFKPNDALFLQKLTDEIKGLKKLEKEMELH